MGCVVRILSNLESAQVEALKRNREQAIEVIIEELKDWVYDNYSNAIEYFKDYDPDMSVNSDELILGCERPAELLDEVEKWNQSIADEAIQQCEALEKQAMKDTGSCKISDLIRNRMRDGDFVHPEYPASVYCTYKALAALDDMFSYGNDCLVYVTGDCEYQHCGTMIPSELLRIIKQHPEDYFIVRLCYD